MSRKFLGTSLALAAGLCLAGAAHADGLAYSVTNVTGLNFYKGGGTSTTILDYTDFNPGSLSFTDQANLSTSLNGNSISTSPYSITGGGIPLTSMQLGAVPSVYPFGMSAVTPPLGSGAYSAAEQTGIAITGLPGVPYSGIGGAGSTAAYAAVVGSGVANSQTTLSLSSGFTFVTNAAGAITFAFHAEQYQTSFLNSALSTVTAGSLSMNITNSTGQTIFSWSPGQTIVGGTVNKEACSLQGSTGVAFPNIPNQNTYQCLGDFSATTGNLLANTKYNFTFSQNNSANAIVLDIPEPSSLALVGLALVGMGFAARRSQVKR